jgi:hypothetical protein
LIIEPKNEVLIRMLGSIQQCVLGCTLAKHAQEKQKEESSHGVYLINEFIRPLDASTK